MKLPADIVQRLRRHYDHRPVCVTGGAGFIGGHLVDALLSVGATITVIDDLSNSTIAHLADLIDLEPERVRFVQGSILDDEAVAEAVGRGGAGGGAPARTVFHLAALGSVPRSIAEPQRTWSVNATGTVRILEAARRAKAERMVLAASSSAYGNDPALPKVETQLPAPASPYAASKLAGEEALGAWSRAYGLSTVSLRYFNIFGPRQSPESDYAAVIPAFAKRILAGEPPLIHGDGEQSRDFTFVANAVLATLLAGASEKPLAGEVVNVGTGRRVTLRELARAMTAIVEREMGGSHPEPVFGPARAGDVRHSLADLTRARALLSYGPIATLEEGLAETIAHLRQALAEA